MLKTRLVWLQGVSSPFTEEILIKKHSAIGFAAAALLALAAGCGQADKTVALSYPPEQPEFSVAVTVDRFEEETTENRIIYLQSFDDQPTIGLVGEIKNPLGKALNEAAVNIARDAECVSGY